MKISFLWVFLICFFQIDKHYRCFFRMVNFIFFSDTLTFAYHSNFFFAEKFSRWYNNQAIKSKNCKIIFVSFKNAWCHNARGLSSPNSPPFWPTTRASAADAYTAKTSRRESIADANAECFSTHIDNQTSPTRRRRRFESSRRQCVAIQRRLFSSEFGAPNTPI